MNAIMYALAAGAFLWLILRNNGYVPGPIQLMRKAAGEDKPEIPESEYTGEFLPFCEGCPDHEACMQGGCYLDGGPVRPPMTTDCPDGNDCAHGGRHWQGTPPECQHEGGHGAIDDPMHITGMSCEGIVSVVVDDEKFKTTAWKAREATERMQVSERGEDLSFLKGAGPAERQQWVMSWAERHPDVPRPEIVRLLVKHSGITDRQARRDVSAVLRSAD